ncbi:uncharacterized protein LOC131728707 [Acipenser ruthenus]|uniref:uncharacterized protein LOC131728707 n=1 Tax=Acipenser ruthenus TaxID=7906 RepID=UPI002740AC63|nr:uncharacterized protein LOC131728707 [Acipenser ruthenus]
MPQFISCWTVLVILVVSGLPCQAISVTGILGDSVILPSCMPANFTPSKVTWSIFKNDTQIATLRPTSTKVDWWPEFEDRLLLNANNGSLQIKNLQRKDAMIYTLNIYYNTNKPCNNLVNLRIIEPIPKPNITIEKTEQCGSCNFFVKCLVTKDSEVNYSLKLTDDSIGNENGSILKVRNIPFNTKRSFTCVASNNVTQSSTTVTEHCGNTEPIAKAEITIQKTEQRRRCNFILKCFVSNHSNFNYVWNNADDSSVSRPILEVDIAFNTKRSFTCVASNSLTTSTATVTEHCGNTDYFLQLNVWRNIAIIGIIIIIIIIIGTIIPFKSQKIRRRMLKFIMKLLKGTLLRTCLFMLVNYL